MKKKIALTLSALMIVAALAGCGTPNKDNSSSGSDTSGSVSEPAKTPELADIHTAVKDVYGENYIPSAEITEQMLTEVYGLNMENADSFVAEGPMMSTHVDTFIAIKAKEGKAADIETQLKAYKEKLVADSTQYPMNLDKVNSAEIFTEGDYVFFVMLGSFYEGTDEAEGTKFAQDEVKKGVDAIKGLF